jgi:hypothetical protein
MSILLLLLCFRFVRPIYPDECTDDFEYIRTHDCISMTWPKHVDRQE